MKAVITSEFYLRGTLQKVGKLIELDKEQFEAIAKKGCVKEATKEITAKFEEEDKLQIIDREIKVAPKVKGRKRNKK